MNIKSAFKLLLAALLKQQKVKIGIGTDSYGTDSQREALYLRKLGIYSKLEMLKMWCETTTQLVFPTRKIGFLKNGYEASFLVLNNDPLENFEAVKNIRLRFKQGYPIEIKK